MSQLKTLSRSEMSQIKRSKTKVDGKKVVTDDVKKLKSLEVEPEIHEHDRFNYHREPIQIEYYIPKESRFAYETKYLFIKLVDPQPKNDNQKLIMNHFSADDQPIDIIKVMDTFPQFLMPILDHYNQTMHLHESCSQKYQMGLKENPELIRPALYLNEVLRKYEPTLPALEILGDFTTYNINWCIRYLNRHQIKFTTEDLTTEYLIFRHKQDCYKKKKVIEERFEILSEIFLEQAFPEDFDDEDFFT